MEWTDLRVTVPQSAAELAEDIAGELAEGGIYIEDYSDLESEVQAIAHVDLIEQALLDKNRTEVIIHLYLAPGQAPAATAEQLRARLAAVGIPARLGTASLQQEDWENGWKAHYHAVEVSPRLAVVPSWEQYTGTHTVLRLDPGMAFGTGTHETTALCLQALDEHVKGGERMLDIGTGSGILAIAALLLGAAEAEGVDIDPMCVRVAGENAALNGVQDHFQVLVGDLSETASGRYEVITANIVANAIIQLAPSVPPLLAPGGLFVASGIIDTRLDETLAALRAAGLVVDELREQNGWECVLCHAEKDGGKE